MTRGSCRGAARGGDGTCQQQRQRRQQPQRRGSTLFCWQGVVRLCWLAALLGARHNSVRADTDRSRRAAGRGAQVELAQAASQLLSFESKLNHDKGRLNTVDIVWARSRQPRRRSGRSRLRCLPRSARPAPRCTERATRLFH